MYIQSILIIHGFCICEFFYLPEFICNLEIDTGITLAIFVGNVQSRKKSESPACMFPAGVGQHGLVLLLQLSYCKQGSFCGLFSAMLFTFLCFLLVIVLFKMPSKHSAEVLSSGLKHKEAVMCLMERICGFVSFVHYMSYSAVGCKFDVNKSTMNVFKQK